MKILYLNNPSPDYLSIMLFHGLVSLGHEVTDLFYMYYMDADNESFIDRKDLYGYGFSYAFTLPGNRKNIDRQNIDDKIAEHYFDIVIFNNIAYYNKKFRDILQYHFLPLVLDKYSLGEILLVDGNDESSILDICYHYNNSDKILYFKRELMVGNCPYNELLRVFPISYAIPKCKFQPKTKYDIPVDQLVYHDNHNLKNGVHHTFTNEQDYYNHINSHCFYTTGRRGGWDRMKHYEIIANFTLPVFEDILSLPKGCMVNWPIDLQIAANSLCNELNKLFSNRIVNTFGDKFYNYYDKLLDEFYDYAYNNLTTENLAKYVLKFV